MKGEIIIQQGPLITHYAEGHFLTSMVDGIPQRILVKVPEPMYQLFYDWAMQRTDKDTVKADIMKELKDWVLENYKPYGIVSFEDYSTREAEAFNRQLKEKGITYRLTWGMYLMLEVGADTDAYIGSGALPQTQKYLT
jgi:hypothetical protein